MIKICTFYPCLFFFFFSIINTHLLYIYMYVLYSKPSETPRICQHQLQASQVCIPNIVFCLRLLISGVGIRWNMIRTELKYLTEIKYISKHIYKNEKQMTSTKFLLRLRNQFPFQYVIRFFDWWDINTTWFINWYTWDLRYFALENNLHSCTQNDLKCTQRVRDSNIFQLKIG